MSPFLYGLNASTIRGTPVLEQIRLAAAAGYRAIELWYADTDAHLSGGGTLGEIRRAVTDSGLLVPTMIYVAGWFDAEETRWPALREAVARRFEQAAEIGARHVICSPPEGRADLAIGARRYAELLELGRRAGIGPSFEFLGFVEQYRSIEAALQVLATAGGGTTVVDPFHIFRGGGSVESLALLRADQIAVSHFNDVTDRVPRDRQGDGDRVLPGEGVFDLRRHVALLRAIGFQGVLSLELFREDLWARDPREVARLGLEKLREVVES